MKKLITLFSIAVAVSFSASAQLSIPFMNTAPTIDGVSDDWSETWIDQAQANANSTTSAMSSKFQIGHDDDNIYLIVEVQDATPNNDATVITDTYQRDCIEFFVSMHSVTEDPALVAGDWQLRVQRATELETMFESKEGTAEAEAAGDFVASVDDDGASMYTVEMKFSKAALAQDSDFDGENIRMELQTADNTDGTNSGRTQQMYWMDNSDQGWQDINICSPAVLAPNLVGVKENANVKASAFINKANVLKVKNMTGVIYVYDVTGKLALKADAKETINVATLKSGLYIVKNNDFSTKVIKK
jgi:hypothetical protein